MFCVTDNGGWASLRLPFIVATIVGYTIAIDKTVYLYASSFSMLKADRD